jgi:hypothetical protein
MSIKVFSRACLLSLIAAASIAAGAAHAADRARAHRATNVTGSIEASTTSAAEPSPMVMRAHTAVDRFTEARAAMAHGLLLRETSPKKDIAALQSYMKDLRDDLTAIEQVDPTGAGVSAKKARELADDWFTAGMAIIAPPADGLTEMPLPMLVKTIGDQVATTLDRVVAEASTSATARTAAAPAPRVPVIDPPAFAAAPARADMQPSTRTSTRTTMRIRVAQARVTHVHPEAPAPAPCVPKPMTQNEASARLFIEGLPLFLPPAALFIDDREFRDDACQP